MTVTPQSPEFEIVIRSLDPDYQNKVFVRLHVRFTKTYPKTPPILSIKSSQGLSDEQLQRARSEIIKEASARLGYEMIYELSIFLQEFLSKNNIAHRITGKSFHEEMVQRNRDTQTDMELQSLQIEQQRAEEELIRKQYLEEKIQAELTRKEESAALMTERSKKRYQGSLSTNTQQQQKVVKQWSQYLTTLTFDIPISISKNIIKASNTFTTVVLEPTAVHDPYCIIYNAYPSDLSLEYSRLALNFNVQEYIIEGKHYQSGAGQKALKAVINMIQELTEVRHDYIVPIHTCTLKTIVDPEGGNLQESLRIYILTDPCQGDNANQTLKSTLEVCGTMGISKVRLYLKQILLALVHLHTAGFIHMSLHPENVLLKWSGPSGHKAKLFNVLYREKLAALHRVTPLSSFFGMPNNRIHRVAPEVIGQPDMIGRKNDIWCVGLLGLQMIFGLESVYGSEMGSEPELLNTYKDELPGSLFRVLSSMLSVQYQVRPTAIDILKDPFFSEGVPKREPSVLQLVLDSASKALKHDVNKRYSRVNSQSGTAATTPVDPSNQPMPHFSISNFRLQPDKEPLEPDASSHGVSAGVVNPKGNAPLPPIPSNDKSTNYPDTSLSAEVSGGMLVGTDLRRDKVPPVPSFVGIHRASTFSRYKLEYEEVDFLGKGGFGSVVKVRNRLDGRYYAIKRIKISADPRDKEREKILREVRTISGLQHQYIVRYYSTWEEEAPVKIKGKKGNHGELGYSSSDPEPSFGIDLDSDSSFDDSASDNNGLVMNSTTKSCREEPERSQGKKDNKETPTTKYEKEEQNEIDDDFSEFYDMNTDLFTADGFTSNFPHTSLRFGTMGEQELSDIGWKQSQSRNGNSKRNRRKGKSMECRSIQYTKKYPKQLSPENSGGSSESSDGSSDDSDEVDIQFASNCDGVESEIEIEFGSNGSSEDDESKGVSSQDEYTNSAMIRTKDNGNYSKEKYNILHIQMEYCENKTLSDLIAEGIDDSDEIWRLFRQILEGLVHIHNSKMIHRDLKPVNIFLSASGDVKIGDFGLATSNYAPIEARTSSTNLLSNSMSSVNITNISKVQDMTFTADIGTSIYVAPEVQNRSSKESVRYDQKVDMYSLGIILFEMCYPLKTAMERAKVITALRRPEIIFPEDFPFVDRKGAEKIIRKLLDHNILNRPSSSELLEDRELPQKVEKEYVKDIIKTVVDPSQPFYEILLGSMFSVTTDAHIDASYDYRTGKTRDEELNPVYLDRIREFMTHVFRKHAGVEISTPLLTPYLKDICYDGQVRTAKYIDPKGIVVDLPVDPVIPFARYVVRTDLKEIKRYCFDRFYRKNVAGGQPLYGNVANFDVVTNVEAHAVGISEVLSVTTDILKHLPSLQNVGLHIIFNHSIVLEAILFRNSHYRLEQGYAASGVGESPFSLTKPKIQQKDREIYGLLRRFYGTKLQYKREEIVSELFTHLFVNSAEIKAQIKSMLAGFDHLGDYIDAVDMLMGKDGLGGSAKMYPFEIRKKAQMHVQLLKQAFRELNEVLEMLNIFGVNQRILLCPLFTHHMSYYQNEYCFQVVTGAKSPDVLAVGGRYDSLIKHFSYLVNDSTHSNINSILGLTPNELTRNQVQQHSMNDGYEKARGSMAVASGSAALGTGSGVAGIGVSFNLDTIIRSMAKYQEDLLQKATIPSFGLWTRKRCDVVVASFGNRQLLAERVELARELWASNIRADFLYNDDPEMTMERLVRICQSQGMNWIVTLKLRSTSKTSGKHVGISEMAGRHSPMSSRPTSASSGRSTTPGDRFICKVRNILQRSEKEVSLKELCPWLLSAIHEQYQIDCVVHDFKSSKSSSLSNLFEPHPMPKENSLKSFGSAPDQTNPANTSSQPTFSANDERRYEVIFLDANKNGKNLNRQKAKQRTLITDRATGNVKKTLNDLKQNAPVLIIPISYKALKRLAAEESIINDDGFKKVFESSPAHQRNYIAELRSQLEKYIRQGTRYVWLYSSNDDESVILNGAE
ncbi:eukaryotic translation initiation factor 2-alpha kinase [Mycoemilia scoparia]|uniref:non-specific serine/threonine protein kinase n=1 Tax=Mycoemilia scoparia TaxID=417184 RepID=A0A9W8ABK3_9FUNG|nr:eukaryotic translation initiation factor 2-alpha kinase [Mycoemilia scoparia]